MKAFGAWGLGRVVAGSLALACGSALQAASAPMERRGPARLVLHDMMGGVVTTPQFVAENLKWIEGNREFLDGLLVRLPKSSFAVMKNEPLDYGAAAAEAAPMKGLRAKTLKHNLALIFTDKPPDPFDDWSTIIRNWATFARVVRDAGFEGIAYDNEEYAGHWHKYPDTCKYPQKTLQEYQDQVRLRGKEVMQAVVAEFPRAAVLTFHGPSVSEPKAPEAALFPQWQHANQLQGPFFVGFVEGKGRRALVVDGGELYALRTPEEFEAAYQFQKRGIASGETHSAFIPPALRPTYAERVSVSYGIYNTPWQGRDMNAALYGATALNALRRADHYVWLYPERATFLKPGGIGDDWVEAMRQAKRAHLDGWR